MKSGTVFKPSFRVSYLWVFGLSTVGAAGVIIVRDHAEVDLLGFMVAMNIGALLAIPLTWFWVTYSTVCLAAEGLEGRDTRCRVRLVRWTEAESLRPFSLFGLRYLRVRASGASSSIWVPLFLAQMSTFRSAVEAAAGPESQWARVLRDERA
jgi:hypothetical protein